MFHVVLNTVISCRVRVLTFRVDNLHVTVVSRKVMSEIYERMKLDAAGQICSS